MIGAQASSEQMQKILSYIDIGREEGAQVLTGGTRNLLPGDLAGGFYVKPTVFKGNNKMRIFQEEIFGPVVSVTTFKDDAEALAIANDTLYGLGAGIWSRDASRLYRFGRAIQAGPGLDQLLPCLSGARRLRRLQAIGCRPRDPQDDAGSLPADQELAGQLQPEEARLLLISRLRTSVARGGLQPARNDAIRNFKKPSLLFAMPFRPDPSYSRYQGGTVLHHVSTT
jgi:hypothetical protein